MLDVVAAQDKVSKLQTWPLANGGQSMDVRSEMARLMSTSVNGDLSARECFTLAASLVVVSSSNVDLVSTMVLSSYFSRD